MVLFWVGEIRFMPAKLFAGVSKHIQADLSYQCITDHYNHPSCNNHITKLDHVVRWGAKARQNKKVGIWKLDRPIQCVPFSYLYHYYSKWLFLIKDMFWHFFNFQGSLVMGILFKIYNTFKYSFVSTHTCTVKQTIHQFCIFTVKYIVLFSRDESECDTHRWTWTPHAILITKRLKYMNRLFYIQMQFLILCEK